MIKATIGGTFDTKFGRRLVEEVNKDPRTADRFCAHLGDTWQSGGIGLETVVAISSLVIEVLTFVVMLIDRPRSKKDGACVRITQEEARDLYRTVAVESSNELDSANWGEVACDSTTISTLRVKVKAAAHTVTVQICETPESLGLLLETEQECGQTMLSRSN